MQGSETLSEEAVTGEEARQTGLIVWDYATLEEQIPELKERDLKNTRIKKISSRLAECVVRLGKAVRGELKVVEGNRNHLLSMTKSELERVEPEILSEALETVVLSLVEALKAHRPSYQKLLKLQEDRDVSVSELKEYHAKVQSLSEALEESRQEKLSKLSGMQKTLREREDKISGLELDLDRVKSRLLKLENEPSGFGSRRRIGPVTTEERSWERKGDRLSESGGLVGLGGSGLGGLGATGTTAGLSGNVVSTKEFRDIKRLIDEEKGDLGLVATKNKQISLHPNPFQSARQFPLQLRLLDFPTENPDDGSRLGFVSDSQLPDFRPYFLHSPSPQLDQLSLDLGYHQRLRHSFSTISAYQRLSLTTLRNYRELAFTLTGSILCLITIAED